MLANDTLGSCTLGSVQERGDRCGDGVGGAGGDGGGDGVGDGVGDGGRVEKTLANGTNKPIQTMLANDTLGSCTLGSVQERGDQCGDGVGGAGGDGGGDGVGKTLANGNEQTHPNNVSQ
jgi:hypothetical protein